MNLRNALVVVGLACTATFAIAGAPEAPKKPAAATPAAAAPAGMPALPPGWTEADMQACMVAGTPGPQHAKLAEGAGTWAGKCTMWMAPGTPATNWDCTTTVVMIMDGKFAKCETKGDMPGMGPFNGGGVYGFDNVSQTFQSCWIDNCGTGMMQGKGELSSDGKTFTWNYVGTCPITKKPTTMREVETITGKDTKKMEMYGIDPKSGKEFKMMEIMYNRTGPAKTMSSAQ